MAETWDVGDEIRTTATFANDVGQIADPTSVVCIARAPDGRRLDLAAARVSQGVYEAFLTLDEPKTWAIRWAGTGAITAAEEIPFTVRKSRVL